MVDITDLGRVLTAMAIHVNPGSQADKALRAGAAKCAEIAKEQFDDEVPSEPAWIDHRISRPTPMTYVEVKFFDGSTDIGYAKNFIWINIIAYRVVDNPEQTS